MNSEIFELRLEPNISFRDIINTDNSGCNTFRITISANSSLSVLADGLFLSLVQSITNKGKRLSVLITFRSNEIISEGGEYLNRIDFLLTLSGYALISAASEVKDSQGKEFRKELLSALWEQIKGEHGTTKQASRFNIFSREPDTPIPQVFGGGQIFPKSPNLFRDTFKIAIKGLAGDYGPFSYQQEHVVSYFFEVAQNAHQHGRENSNGQIDKGIRGVAFEKLHIPLASEILNRRDFLPEFANYLNDTQRHTTSNIFYSCTVADLGIGIHNTMPDSDKFSAIELINQAFLTGKGRKSKEGESLEGSGLPYVYSCATALKAFLLVKSGSYFAFKDFSNTSNQSDLVLMELVGPDNGTSVSLTWPERFGTEDQLGFSEFQ